MLSMRRGQFLPRLPVWSLAVLARVLTKLHGESWLAKRPELVVAHNSFRRLVDGVHMRRNGFSPYEGDMLHCAPLLLDIIGPLVDQSNVVFAIFMVFDLIIAELLRKTASLYAENNERVEKSKVEQICNLVENFYLFNPLVIATCAICSLSVIYNLLITMFLFSFVKGWLIGSAVLCGLLVELTLYPVVFIFALFVRFVTLKEKTIVCLLTLLSIGAFTLLDIFCSQGMQYINSTHLFFLNASDLTPNVGIFWYFFTEVFTHFRLFFLWVFQLNVFVYLFPLTLTLRKSPVLLLHQLLILISVFASYPTMADSALYLSLLPIFVSLHKYARWTLVIAVSWVTCVVLSPVMWHMWIVTGSGNANFYFAVTLCYSMAQIFLMTDLLYSHLREKAAEERGSVADDDTSLFVFK